MRRVPGRLVVTLVLAFLVPRFAPAEDGSETKSYETTRARMLENVQAAWSAPQTEVEKPTSLAGPREMTDAEKQAAALRSKLDSSRIPAVAFRNADIQQVVLVFLHRLEIFH